MNSQLFVIPVWRPDGLPQTAEARRQFEDAGQNIEIPCLVALARLSGKIPGGSIDPVRALVRTVLVDRDLLCAYARLLIDEGINAREKSGMESSRVSAIWDAVIANRFEALDTGELYSIGADIQLLLELHIAVWASLEDNAAWDDVLADLGAQLLKSTAASQSVARLSTIAWSLRTVWTKWHQIVKDTSNDLLEIGSRLVEADVALQTSFARSGIVPYLGFEGFVRISKKAAIKWGILFGTRIHLQMVVLQVTPQAFQLHMSLDPPAQAGVVTFNFVTEGEPEPFQVVIDFDKEGMGPYKCGNDEQGWISEKELELLRQKPVILLTCDVK